MLIRNYSTEDKPSCGETRQGEVSFDLREGVKPFLLFYMVTRVTDDYLQVSVQP